LKGLPRLRASVLLDDMSADADIWNPFRAGMPITAKWAYFDHAAVSPLPAATADVLADWSRQCASEGDTVWPSWAKALERTRARAADLIGAGSDEIALVHSTSEGVSLVAEGFPWQSGDNVVTLENEFPSNQYPWLNQAHRGVEVRRVPVTDGRVDLSRLQQACDRRTRLVAISWVGYLSGWRVCLDDVAELAHARGALLFVDAIQGLGVYPLDVARTPIDFLAADGHKWLLGPEGAGVFYVRREHLDLLHPIVVGWNSVLHASDYGRIELNFKPSAARFEGGSPNVPGGLAMGASLELLEKYGTERIAARVLHLADTIVDRLRGLNAIPFSPHSGNHRSAIVSFELPDRDPVAVRKRCLEAGVALSHRSGKLRVSPHAYQNDDDIDRLLDALAG
jgi:selenocysteine lyase/cysteine desulfurase